MLLRKSIAYEDSAKTQSVTAAVPSNTATKQPHSLRPLSNNCRQSAPDGIVDRSRNTSIPRSTADWQIAAAVSEDHCEPCI